MGGGRRPQMEAFRAAAIVVSTAVLVVSVVLLVADGSSWAEGARGGAGSRGLMQGGSGLLQRNDRRGLIVAELLRRQNSIASIQKSLEAEEEQSNSVLLRFLALDGNGTARGNGTAPEGREDGGLQGNTTTEVGMSNTTDAMNVSDANSTDVGTGRGSGGGGSADNKSATSASPASNASFAAGAGDEYAEARKILARSNDTAELDVALQEQPVTEYSNQTIRWAPPPPPPSPAYSPPLSLAALTAILLGVTFWRTGAIPQTTRERLSRWSTLRLTAGTTPGKQ